MANNHDDFGMIFVDISFYFFDCCVFSLFSSADVALSCLCSLSCSFCSSPSSSFSWHGISRIVEVNAMRTKLNEMKMNFDGNFFLQALQSFFVCGYF